MKNIVTLTIIICLSQIAGELYSQSTAILIGGEETELSPEGVVTGNGSSQWGGLGAALLDTFNIYYQPLGEGEFQDNLFPDPEVYSFQMNIPEGLPNYQSQGVHESFWNSAGREGEGVLPWINEDWRGGQYFDAQYRPAGDEAPFGLVSDSVQWKVDYWDVDENEEICFIHTCLAGMVTDFVYNEETGDATALLTTLQTAYLGYGEDGEPGPGAVEYNGGTYQGFDSFRERSGLIDYPAYFFQYDGESNEGSLTPCGTKVSVRGEDGVKGYYDAIQDGIDASEDGDTVLVKPGEYVENINFDGKSIVVMGNPDDPSEVVIDGNANGSVVVAEGGENTILDGFTITGGEAEEFGGGISCRRSNLTIRNLIVDGNSARSSGGGIWLGMSEYTLENVIVRNNVSEYGGGVLIIGADMTISNCFIVNNTSWRDGGGIKMYSSSGTLIDVSIRNNLAEESDGGISIDTGSDPTLIRVAVIDNVADQSGGGITCTRRATPVMINVTVAGNSCRDEDGGGIACGETNPTMINCVVWNNDPPEIRNVEAIEATFSNFEGGFEGEGNIDEDPLFIDPEEGDYHLTEDSPCIDTGDPESEEDPDGTRADMGAFYFHQEPQDEDGLLYVPDEYETIQQAIDTAVVGDSVLVSPGEYVENINFSGKAIAVIGNPENPGEVVIDGDSSGTVVTFENEETLEAILNGFSIQNGSAEYAGGIKFNAASPRVMNCIISNNSAASSGGGIYCIRSSEPELSNLIITENHVGNGGGGVDVAGSSPSLYDCVISNNTSDDFGAGMSNDLASPRVFNCVFSNNTSNGAGGAISNYTHSYPIFVNCTITGNSSSDGGGIWNGMSFPLVINSIIWENSPDEISGDQATVNFSNILGGFDGESNIDSDPLFTDPENSDFRLTEGSPCIDVGTTFFVLDEDTVFSLTEDDYNGDAPDMGAIESEFGNTVFDPFSSQPVEYSLQQPFPNPFNSMVRLSYTVPKLSQVSIKLYDIAGSLVEEIVGKLQSSGQYAIVWDASTMPSGIYLARLQAVEFSQTVKLMLMK